MMKANVTNEQFVEMYKVQCTMYKSSSSCGFAAVEITLAAPTAAAPNARRYQDNALQALSVPRFSAADLYIVHCTLYIPTNPRFAELHTFAMANTLRKAGQSFFSRKKSATLTARMMKGRK